MSFSMELCDCCKHKNPLKKVCHAYPDGIPYEISRVLAWFYERKGRPYPVNCNGSGLGFEPTERYVKYKERVDYCEAHNIPRVDD